MKKIFEEILNNIPDYKEFLTVDEMNESSKKLAEKYNDVVEIFEIGRTRDNYPLQCLKIGNGKENALMFGCPHPNEPIGAMLLEYFSEELAKNKELRDSLDYTWYIIKAWDADGTKLNEGWFKKEPTLYNYSRNFFRPAGHQQVDWTFPLEYKKLKFENSIPETKAMMKLIDEIKPKFIYSLHNAGFGGAYWYLTKALTPIHDEMREIAVSNGVPLNLGEPEAPYCIAIDKAMYKSLGIKDEYDYLEKYGIENPEELINVGTCSAEYSYERHGSFTLLTELPYFYDKRIEDLSDSDITRKDAITEKLNYNRETNEQILDTIEFAKEYVDSNNPFKLALEAFTEGRGDDATERMINEDESYMKPATVSEKVDNLLVAKFYKSLSFGLLIRLLENAENSDKIVDDSIREEIKNKKQKIEKIHKDLIDYLEKELEYHVVPIKNLIKIQLGCGLVVADYLQNN